MSSIERPDAASPDLTPQQEALVSEQVSGFSAYRKLVVGEASLPYFLYYEFLTFLFGNFSGLPGFGLRALLYPGLFASCGSRPAFGRGMVIRNPKKISIGKKLLADDYSVLDVRGESGKIILGDYVSLGRFSTITSKEAEVRIGNGVNIGSYCRIATQSSVEIGESVLIAAYSYIGPGNHRPEPGKPLISSSMDIRGGVKIGSHVWIGARATILDGVTIGKGAVIGAHSLVREDIPEKSIAVGSPARIIGQTSDAV